MIIIILSAGRGKRLGSKTEKLPKCLVKVKGKPIIDYLENFRKKFRKTIIITGYKRHLISNKFHKNKSISFSVNKNYEKTNMVYSLFRATKKQIKKNDVVVCYSDIIFDPQIFYYFKSIKKTFITINGKWLNLWKKRMPFNKIKNDAEDLILDKTKVVSIGKKINNKLPKFQFMGLMKIMNKDFFKLKKFFLKQKKDIDFTSFLDLAIKHNIIKLSYKKTSNYWYEIDTKNDLNIFK